MVNSECRMVKGEVLRLRRVLLCFTLFVFGAVCGLSETRVSVERLGEGDLLPGDVVEFEVVATSEGFERLELVEPRSASLRFVAKQSFPVQLNGESGYESKWILVYQILRSGEVAMEDGSLLNARGEVAVAIEPMALSALGFGGELDHDGVERFGDTESGLSGGSRGLVLTGLLAVMALVGFYFVWQQNRRKGIEDDSPEQRVQQEIEDLRTALTREVVAQSRMERFLERYGDRFSEQLRFEIKRYLYSESRDGAALARKIGEELAQ